MAGFFVCCPSGRYAFAATSPLSGFQYDPRARGSCQLGGGAQREDRNIMGSSVLGPNSNYLNLIGRVRRAMLAAMVNAGGLKGERGRRFATGTRRFERPTRQTPPYKVIAVGVYDDQAQSLDRTAAELQRAGYVKANRSFIVQALVRRLQQEVEGLTSEQVLQMFFDSYLKRPLSSAASRNISSSEQSPKQSPRRRGA